MRTGTPQWSLPYFQQPGQAYTRQVLSEIFEIMDVFIIGLPFYFNVKRMIPGSSPDRH